MTVRTGLGVDAHRFVEGRRLILGGVEVPHDRGLAGHSDADVLAHAIADALLGAAGLGDIGQHFPDTDPAFADADSMGLLRDVVSRVRDAGCPLALSSDAHVPDQLGYEYERAVELLQSLGAREIVVFERRERRLEPLG